MELSILVGQIATCKLTVWLLVPQIGAELPHSYEARCKVLSAEQVEVDTGAPALMWVDCRKSVQWIAPDHRAAKGKTLMRYTEEDGCVE